VSVVKGFLRNLVKNLAIYLAVFLAASALSRLVLYFRVLDTSTVDVPEAMLTHRLVDRDSMNPSTIGYLQGVRIDSEEVIWGLFEELRNTTLHGTKSVNFFERYPVYLMIMEYGEGVRETFMYIEVAADRRITVHKDGRTAYYGYISEEAYDLLTTAYRDASE
jgi:hypothetical protein